MFPTALLSLLFLNKSSESNYSEAIKFLQSPTLIFHDGSNIIKVDGITRELGASKTIVVGTPAGSQMKEKLDFSLRSAVLIGEEPNALVPYLRGRGLLKASEPILVLVNTENEGQVWLKALWERTRAVNVTVFVTTGTAKYLTWFPYRPSECSNVSTITQLKVTNLFPPKMHNTIYGCTFKVVTTFLSLIAIDANTGLESEIIQNMLKKINAHAEFHLLPYDRNVWTELGDEGEPINGVKMIWENEVDLLYSNMQPSYDTYHYVEHLISHTEDAYSFFVPAPLLAPRASAVYRAFPISIWILVFSSFIGMLIIIPLTLYYPVRVFHIELMHTIALILNLPFKNPNKTSFRIFIAMAYIYALHITTAYQASLMVFISDMPRERAIVTIEDLAESSYPVHIHQSLKNSIKSNSNPEMQAIYKKGVFGSFIDITGVANHQHALMGAKFLFLEIIPSYGYYAGTYKIKMLKEPYKTLPMSFFMSIGHPLCPTLNRYLQWMVETGLPEYYLAKYSKKHEPWRRKPLKPLRVDNLVGSFYILGISLIFATGIFAFENVFRIGTLCRQLLGSSIGSDFNRKNISKRRKIKTPLRINISHSNNISNSEETGHWRKRFEKNCS